MIPLKISEILDATGVKLISGEVGGMVTDVTTDSRKVVPGMLFAAICGENADGHDYIKSAVEKGAACVICEKDVAPCGTIIKVENTIAALGKIARAIMRKLCVPVVGLTGSVGKTTTRDMTYAVVSKMFNTLKNQGNFNNELGVPLTVFSADESVEAAVIEMGMDNFGEIDRLSYIVNPTVSIITNIGMSHIERLGSQENIYKAKSEIFKNTKHSGTVILNGDDKILMAHKDEITQKVITVGVENIDADIVAKNIEATKSCVSFTACGMGKEIDITLPVPGEHNVLNALLAVATGLVFEIPGKEIKDALQNFSMTHMRMDIIKCKKVTIINDCYNAAPASVAAALAVLGKYDNRKVAVLGDIAALGSYSYKAHYGLGADVVKNGIDLLITIGTHSRHIAESAYEHGMDGANIVSVDTVDEAYPVIMSSIREGDVVLVKASRVMALERVSAFLKNNF